MRIKTLFSVISFFFLLLLGCRAQQLKLWTDGPLTWNDFEVAGTGSIQSNESSYAAFTLIRENKVVKTQGVTYKYQDMSAAVTRGMSWVKPGQMNDSNLARHQKEFDILQHFAEMYRDDFLFYNDPLSRRHEMWFDGNKDKLSESYYLSLFKDALDEFHRTGDAGEYPVNPEPFDITKLAYSVPESSSELLVGLTTVIPVGVLSNYFDSPFVGPSLGYGFREGKNYFNGNLTVIETFGISGSYLDLSARYGRVLAANRKTDFSLFAGAGFAFWKDADLFRSTSLYKGPMLTQGISIDISLHKTVNFLSEVPQEREQKLQLKLYVNELYDIERDSFVPYIAMSAGINLGMKDISR